MMDDKVSGLSTLVMKRENDPLHHSPFLPGQVPPLPYPLKYAGPPVSPWLLFAVVLRDVCQ